MLIWRSQEVSRASNQLRSKSPTVLRTSERKVVIPALEGAFFVPIQGVSRKMHLTQGELSKTVPAGHRATSCSSWRDFQGPFSLPSPCVRQRSWSARSAHARESMRRGRKLEGCDWGYEPTRQSIGNPWVSDFLGGDVIGRVHSFLPILRSRLPFLGLLPWKPSSEGSVSNLKIAPCIRKASES